MIARQTPPNPWQRFLLLLCLLGAAALHLYRLEVPGLANLYYAATVRSMLIGWSNFLYASFDPAGFVTVDKPPLGFWVQAGSAALFGFKGLSLLLPQAFAGILSVALLYQLVRAAFGVNAGLAAAALLALTPINVAANRNNTQDGLVVLLCLLAAYCVTRSVHGGGVRWLLGALALVGLGFEIKMMQAYLVLPAILGVYLVAGPNRLGRRLWHLALGCVVLVVVSLSWPLVVDATPETERPFIGSSSNNRVMELILGHNGLNRLLPGGLRRLVPQLSSQLQAPTPQSPAGRPLGGQPGDPLTPTDGPAGAQPSTPSSGAQPLPQAGPGIQTEIGEPGLLRLFSRQLGGQASWFVPLAALGLLAAAWQEQASRRSRRHAALLLWALWLLPQVVFFSVASLFHRYYLEMLSPGIAALAGAGVAALWADYQRNGLRGWLLPLTVAATAVVQIALLRAFPEWESRLAPVVAVGSLAGAAALILARMWRDPQRRLVSAVALGVGGVALLAAPAAWALMPVVTGGNVALPVAGPEALVVRQQPKPPARTKLIDYLQVNRRGERFLVATTNANSAAPIIIVTGEAVMAMGGFSGGDRILTPPALERLVREGEVRYFLLGGNNNPPPDIARWLESRCQPIAQNVWQGIGAPLPGGQPMRLLDCGRAK